MSARYGFQKSEFDYDVISKDLHKYRDKVMKSYRKQSKKIVIEIENFLDFVKKLESYKKNSDNGVDRTILDEIIGFSKTNYSKFVNQNSVQKYYRNKTDPNYEFKFYHIEQLYEDFQTFCSTLFFEFTRYTLKVNF